MNCNVRIGTAVAVILYSFAAWSGAESNIGDLVEQYSRRQLGIAAEDQGGNGSVSLGVANTDWNVDDRFSGHVVILRAAFGGSTKDVQQSNGRFQQEYYAARVDADAQFSVANGIETVNLYIQPISRRDVRDLTLKEGFFIADRGINMGVVQLSRDLPIGIDRYVEITPYEIFGTVGWKPSSDRDFMLLARASMSAGLAHADRTGREFASDTLTNLYFGHRLTLTAVQRHCAETFSRGHDQGIRHGGNQHVTRDAVVILSLDCRVGDRWSFGMAGEKRAGGERYTGEYEKSKRYIFSFSRKVGW